MPIYFERCLGKNKLGSRQQDSRTLVPTHSPAAGCCRPIRGSSWSLGVAGRRLSSASGTGPVEECRCWQVPRLVPKLCRVLLCRAFPWTGRLVATARISTASMRPLAATGEQRARRMTAPASAGCTKMERGQEKKWTSGEARGLSQRPPVRGSGGPNMFCVPGRERCASLLPASCGRASRDEPMDGPLSRLRRQSTDTSTHSRSGGYVRCVRPITQHTRKRFGRRSAHRRASSVRSVVSPSLAPSASSRPPPPLLSAASRPRWAAHSMPTRGVGGMAHKPL